MFKKLISLTLVLALVSSLALTAFASDYSDLDGHWAEDYILDLVDMGYLTGYTDGTMQPDNNITTVEALVLLSRFYNPSDAVVAEIHDQYGEDVERLLEPTLEWAYDEVELCIAAGIVSVTELGNLPMTGELQKELLSVLLVRAIQKIEDAQSNTTILTFDDTDTITSSYLPYVAVLVDEGIINGDNYNNFSPKLSVTRAVVATMLVRALTLLDEENVSLELTGYGGYRTVEGLIYDVDADDYTFQLRDLYGKLYEFTYTDDTVLSADGSDMDFDDDYVGEYAVVAITDDGVRSVAVDVSAYAETWVQGMIYSYSPSGSGSTIKVTSLDTGSTSTSIGAVDMVMYKNGVQSSTLSSGLFVTMIKDSGGVNLAYAYTPDFEIDGVISRLVIGTTVDFAITTEDGDTLLYPFAIGNLPDMTTGSMDLSIEQLSVGDEVTLTVNDCVVTDIESYAEFDSMMGTLSAITNALSGTYWTVTNTNGVAYELTLSSSVVVTEDGDYIDVDDISIGDYLEIQLTGTQIISMDRVDSLSSSAQEVSGTILSVDTSANKITLFDDNDNLFYITTNELGSILSIATGRTIGIAYLEEGDYVTAYGYYADSTYFTATSMVLKN